MCRTSYEPDGSGSSEDEEEEEEDSWFPSDEVDSLERRHRSLERPLPILDRIPTACGIVQNLQLVGVFPTARWLTDRTMPPDVKELFGGTPFFALGEYRVAHLQVQDARRRTTLLTLIINTGVEGLLTGFWGGAFERGPPHRCLARFENTGDLETTVKERHSKRLDWVFHEFENLEFWDAGFQGAVPGICLTQLERVLGVAVEFLLGLDWNHLLPESLVEIRDMSPRAERQQRAGRRRAMTTPKKLIHENSFSF